MSSPASSSLEPHGRDQRFRAMFDGELRYVWNSLRYLGVRPDDLADVAHEVFLQVIRHLDEYDADRPVRPWLFAFAAPRER